MFKDKSRTLSWVHIHEALDAFVEYVCVPPSCWAGCGIDSLKKARLLGNSEQLCDLIRIFTIRGEVDEDLGLRATDPTGPFSGREQLAASKQDHLLMGGCSPVGEGA
jgi:hypothetical protein